MGILAVLIGIAAVACAFLATLLYGTVGGIVAGVLGAIAIALAILKRKKAGRGGIAGIIIGALAIILAFSMTSTWSNMFTELHNKAKEFKPDGLWAQVTEDTKSGFMGIIKKIPEDEASINAFIDEMNELNKTEEGQGE